jgi:hypothetical protein
MTMTSPDDEFDEFLRRRRPMFGRADDLEPPLELDRVVLRQAREAIESERPHRVFRAPAWGMPVALAATLVLAFTIFLRVGTPGAVKKPEVTVQNVSRQIEMPAAAPSPPPADSERATTPAAAPMLAEQSADKSAVVVDLGADAAGAAAPAPEAQRARRVDKVAEAAAPAPSSQAYADSRAGNEQRVDSMSSDERRAEPALAASAAPKPEYRRTSQAWLAEIERLRAAGDSARADAELAEYKREHRAYAVAPDR